MSYDESQDGPPSSAGRIDLAQIHPILPQLIDSLSDAVLVVDRGQRIVAANRRYLEAFGRGSSTLRGSVCTAVVDCPERSTGVEQERCATCDVLQLKQPARRLRVVPDETGAQRRWEGTFSPVAGPSGEITHVVEVWRDVSERSRLESQLGHSERLASLGILAAGVAHEINNPLAAVLAGVESLQRWLNRGGADHPDDARAEEALEVLGILERETHRVREITDKLMLLAQPYSVTPVRVDLNSAAADTLQLLRYQMQKQGVLSKADFEPGLALIWAKESAIRSVCMNLMMNAVQAMSKGGTLIVRTGRSGIAGVLLEISDTGPGIPPQNLDRIWDPFFTTKPTGQGTGLGLSITQRIVVRHGGQIRAENLDAGGARFTIELPVEGSGGTGLG